MNMFDKYKNKPAPQYEEKLENKTKIDSDLEVNIKAIKQRFEDCNDLVYREFKIGGVNGTRAFMVYIDGMVDKILLDNFVLTPLMVISRAVKPDFDEIKSELFDAAQKNAMTVTDFKETEFIEEVLTAALSGDTGLIIDGYPKAINVATKFWPARGISEPSSETVLRGSRDGFTETIRMNTALVRRRIRDTRFKLKQKQIGVRSKTDIAVMYIDDIVDKRILEDLNQKLEKINIDAILDSGYIQQFIEDKQFTPFPQVQTTERPDVVAAALYEGRVAILVDNSPFALIVPVTLTSFFQSSEDFYSRTSISSFIRIIRIIAGIISITAPALYIAMVSFHPGILPSRLALFIAATREGVPFPAFIEAFLMEITFELLREAGVRLPRPIGSTIGIVGGLVIGQAAVTAQLVSPVMLIVVAITAIASFAIPNYEMASAFRLIRFLLMIAAAVYGLYGVVLGYFVVIIHLVCIKSSGVSYLSPIAPLEVSDLKDGPFVRLPWKYLKNRPAHYEPNDIVRQGEEDNNSSK